LILFGFGFAFALAFFIFGLSLVDLGFVMLASIFWLSDHHEDAVDAVVVFCFLCHCYLP
jgi:hypothetical protein